MGHTIVLANQKGGVGKTTTAVNLGAALARSGLQTLIVDLDPQANATSHLGYDKRTIDLSVYNLLLGDCSAEDAIITTSRPLLDLLPATPDLAGAEVEMVSMLARESALRRRLESVRSSYEVIFVDPPPSLGLLTINALTAATGAIIPVQAEYLALEGLSQLIGTIERVQEQLNPQLAVIGLLMTLVDRRTNLAAEVEADLREHFPQLVFETVIPRSIRLGEAPSYGETIFEYDPGSTGADAYKLVANELRQRLEV